MRKWSQSSRKHNGWVERKRRWKEMFAASSEKTGEVANVPQPPKVAVEKVSTE